MNVYDLIGYLDEHRLISPSVAARLRERISPTSTSLTPQDLLEYLVKKNLISHEKAVELVESVLSANAEESSIFSNTVAEPRMSESASAIDEPEGEEIPTLTPIDSDVKLSETTPARSEIPEHSVEPDPIALQSFSTPARNEPALSELSEVTEPATSIRSKKSSKKKRKKGENEWDTSLILYGGGGLVLLILAGGIIYYLLNRESADFVLSEATNYFESGSYTQAIGQYEKFVQDFKGHPEYSAAKVKLGLARLWKDTTNTSDYSQALQTAKSVLDDIDDESEFPSAHRDLASLIPKIAKGLSTQAEEATDPEVVDQRVKQAEEALSLYMNTKYVQKTFRDETLLAEIQETLARVERNRVQNEDLNNALSEMQKAIEARDLLTAYNLRRELLEKHPTLIKSEPLAAKVAEVSAVEAEVVKFTSQSVAAETAERASLLVASLTLAEQQNRGTAEAAGSIAVRIGGALFGLNSSDGHLLWREYVGIDPRENPTMLPGGDVLYTDTAHQELVRVNGTSGKLQWRLSLGGKSLQPVVVGELVYVAMSEGKVHLVNLANGELTGTIQFGQRIAVPPTVASDVERLYVLAEHSSLYTISMADHSCLGVYYLGQNAGNLSVPLVRVLDKLFVAVNTGLASSQLVCLATDEKGVPKGVDLQSRLDGVVNTPLLVEGRRLVAITNLGEISAFEVMNADGKDALSTIAVREAESGKGLARFALLEQGNIWIGDERINKLTIQATGNNIRLSNLENDFSGDIFNHPLHVSGDIVVSVRRPANQAGSIVAATDLKSGQTVWETELGVPLAGAPAVDSVSGTISAVTATGAAYRLDREAMTRRVLDRANRVAGSRRSLPHLTESVTLGDGRLVAGALDSDSLLLYQSGQEEIQLKLIKLASNLTCPLVAWRNGFVAPTAIGQLFFLSSGDGQPLATPFQPPLNAKQKFHWLAPAVVGNADSPQLVLSDGVKKVYLIEVADGAQPNLTSIAETDLGATVLTTPLATAGELIAAGTDDQKLATFKLPELTAGPTVALGGNITWGPFATNDGFVVATTNAELLCITLAGNVKWKLPLEKMEPAGTPLIDGEHMFVAWQLDGVSRISLADGTIAGTAAVDQAVLAGPVPFASRLILAAADGTILVINRP
jgi:outer membrane protein assembly factor BamB/tetratricopeptide (TPR) repeat protein